MHLPSARPTRGRPADGIRIGVQELTRLGMGSVEMAHIADLMRRTADGDDRRHVGQAAVELVRAFPTVYYCFEHPKP
jgi:glycine hydroxymethyltransferase